jgi:predicted MPP superfamily phosphohydrolase
MKTNIIRLLILLAIVAIVDIYVFQAVRVVAGNINLTARRWIYFIYWSITALTISTIVYGSFVPFSTWPQTMRVYLVGLLGVIFLCKLLVVVFLIIDDLVRLIRWGYKEATPPAETGSTTISRSDFLVKTGLIVAGIPFITMIYGMVEGAFDYKVRKLKLKFANLPEAFDGLKIVQLSDIHTGSFVSTEPLKKAIGIMKKQKADVVLFTGDMVNNKSDEAIEHLEALKEIDAPMGVFAILGNHDYGDYVSWPSPEAKKENMQQIYSMYQQLGWKLMNNEHAQLEKDGQKIAIAGVENWSAFSRFPKYGDLEAATKGIPGGMFTVLMSHDPTHWDAQVLKHKHEIGLTLSGHTHGMQFGIETPVFRWSPSQYIYKEWAGLYKNRKKYLYVNRGLGFLGYPGRVGIRPEITVIELKRG